MRRSVRGATAPWVSAERVSEIALMPGCPATSPCRARYAAAASVETSSTLHDATGPAKSYCSKTSSLCWSMIEEA